MEYFENGSVSTEEVAEPQTTETSATVETADVPQEKPVQSAEQNAMFADRRRKQELDEARAELNKLKQQNELLTKATKYYFDGDSPEDLAFKAIGFANEKTADEIKAEYQREAAERARADSTNAELEFYRQQERERAINEDLKAIQAIDPKIKSLDDFGENKNKFIALRANDVDTLTAYNAIKATMPKPPASMGDINVTATTEKDFYTSADVDKLTPQQLSNPKIMERVMASMTKW